MSDPEICPSLARANLSRRRAWAEFQKLRKLLAQSVSLPPPSQPADFEIEGEILRRALQETVGQLTGCVEEFLKATEELRPFPFNREPPEGVTFQRAVQTLNAACLRGLGCRALTRPPTKTPAPRRPRSLPN